KRPPLDQGRLLSALHGLPHPHVGPSGSLAHFLPPVDRRRVAVLLLGMTGPSASLVGARGRGTETPRVDSPPRRLAPAPCSAQSGLLRSCCAPQKKKREDLGSPTGQLQVSSFNSSSERRWRRGMRASGPMVSTWGLALTTKAGSGPFRNHQAARGAYTGLSAGRVLAVRLPGAPP